VSGNARIVANTLGALGALGIDWQASVTTECAYCGELRALLHVRSNGRPWLDCRSCCTVAMFHPGARRPPTGSEGGGMTTDPQAALARVREKSEGQQQNRKEGPLSWLETAKREQILAWIAAEVPSGSKAEAVSKLKLLDGRGIPERHALDNGRRKARRQHRNGPALCAVWAAARSASTGPVIRIVEQQLDVIDAAPARLESCRVRVHPLPWADGELACAVVTCPEDGRPQERACEDRGGGRR
jgi:hypothetical protein